MLSFSFLSGPMTNTARADSGRPALSFSSGSRPPYLACKYDKSELIILLMQVQGCQALLVGGDRGRETGT